MSKGNNNDAGAALKSAHDFFLQQLCYADPLYTEKGFGNLRSLLSDKRKASRFGDEWNHWYQLLDQMEALENQLREAIKQCNEQ